MDGILELDTEEQFEELLELFDAACKEPLDWRNILTIPPSCDEKMDVRVNFGMCHGEIWPES